MQSKAVQAPLSRPDHPDTPPDSPTAQLCNPFEFAKQFLDAIKAIQTPESVSQATVSSGQGIEEKDKTKAKSRASRHEIKKVNERYPNLPLFLLQHILIESQLGRQNLPV
jgi:hypothetical protein